MRKRGFSALFAGAVTVASAVVGPIFPPGIPLIVYGSVTSVSIVQLLLAGIVPALICIVLLMTTAAILGDRPQDAERRACPDAERLESSGQGAALASPRSSGMRSGDKRLASQPISGQVRYRPRPADRSPTPALRRVLVQGDPVSGARPIGAMVEHAPTRTRSARPI